MASIIKLPSGKYQVSWYSSIDKKRKRKTVPSKTEGNKLMTKLNSEALFEMGLPNTGKKSFNYRNMVFKELAEMFIEQHLNFTRSANNRSYIDKAIKKFGNHKLFMITPELVRPWIYSYLRESKLEVSTVKKIAVYIKRIFAWGCEEGLISENPLKYLQNKTLRDEFKRVNRRTTIISDENFWSFIEKLPEYMANVCIAAYCTGMRVGEILELRFQDIDLTQRLIRLSSKQTKERYHKTIGIEEELYQVILSIKDKRENIKPDDYVFISITGSKINDSFLRKKFRKIADKNGFEKLIIHDLRHTYVSRKRKAGFDKSVIKSNTGHRSDSMFHWYNVVEESEIQDLAGFTTQNLEFLSSPLHNLIKEAKANNITLGVIQNLISREWKQVG